MKSNYLIAGKGDTRKIAEFLAQNGDLLLPLVALIESSQIVTARIKTSQGRPDQNQPVSLPVFFCIFTFLFASDVPYPVAFAHNLYHLGAAEETVQDRPGGGNVAD